MVQMNWEQFWSDALGPEPRVQLLASDPDGEVFLAGTGNSFRARRVEEPIPYRVGATFRIPADDIQGLVVQDSSGRDLYSEWWPSMAREGDSLTFQPVTITAT